MNIRAFPWALHAMFLVGREATRDWRSRVQQTVSDLGESIFGWDELDQGMEDDVRGPTELPLVQRLIIEECDSLREMLLAKNRAYGDSFSQPIGIFAKGLPADAQIRVRLDDKLTRLARGTDYANEDTVLDLNGYLILWRVLKRLKAK